MAYAQQRERQPTFNELIERQIIEQKAKFAEDQEQAQRDFQQKLNEIATPTPFCEKAIQRMEMRRQLSEETAQEREKEMAQQQQTTSSTIRSWLLVGFYVFALSNCITSRAVGPPPSHGYEA